MKKQSFVNYISRQFYRAQNKTKKKRNFVFVWETEENINATFSSDDAKINGRWETNFRYNLKILPKLIL